ncbi:MAG: Hpt domain-containing protein, partial [Sphingobium sp.]
MDDLMGDFVAETLENLETLSGEVIAWEANPSDRDRLDAFFRFFHTVKGSCGFLNLPRIERLAHRAEDALAEIRTGERVADPRTISAVLAVMDRVGDITRAFADSLPVPAEAEDDALLDSLDVPSPAPAPAPVAETIANERADVADLLIEDAAQPAVPVGQRERAPRTIRISLSLIDQLMNAVSDMVLARNELSRKLRDNNVDPDV